MKNVKETLLNYLTVIYDRNEKYYLYYENN